MATCRTCNRMAGMMATLDNQTARCLSCEIRVRLLKQINDRTIGLAETESVAIQLRDLRLATPDYRVYACGKMAALPDTAVSWRVTQDGTALACPDCQQVFGAGNLDGIVSHANSCNRNVVSYPCSCGRTKEMPVSQLSMAEQGYILGCTHAN